MKEHTTVNEITYAQAIKDAMCEEMRRDPKVFLLGEDIGIYGGAFGVTRGMLEEFGAERIRDTPISEAAITGAAVGAAMTGMRPVVEIMFSDFITIAMDQLVNQAAKARYQFGGQAFHPHGAAHARGLRHRRRGAAFAERGGVDPATSRG